MLRRNARSQDRAAGGAGFDQPHRLRPRRFDIDDAARRRHQQEGATNVRFGEAGGEALQVARHERLDIGVGERGRGPLVFPDLRADLVAERDRHARQRGFEDFARAQFVRRVDVAVQEDDRERFDARRLDLRRERLQRRFVQRLKDLAVRRHALVGLEPQPARRQRNRPLHIEIVLIEAMLVGHLDRIAEAGGRDQRGLRPLPLDDRVGGERRAVDDEADVAGRHARRRQDFGRARDHRALGRVGRRQQLVRAAPFGGFERQVGEGAADIDSQANVFVHGTIRACRRDLRNGLAQ